MKQLCGRFFIVVLFCALTGYATAQTNTYISASPGNGNFPLSVSGRSASLYISPNDYPGVMIALKNLQNDIQAVTNYKPELLTGKPSGKQVVLAGTIGKSELIDGLIKNKKLDVSAIAGKWETFVIQTIQNPMPGVSEALVIAGSDKRGAIFGIYDVSEQIGVSPWYY